MDIAIVEPGGFPTRFIDNLMQPASRDRDAGYGGMADAPRATLVDFEDFLAANPQQSPQLVADAVVQVVGTTPGTRPFRTEVDRIGMTEPLKGYNEHLAQVTTGLFTNLGIQDMLKLKTAEKEGAYSTWTESMRPRSTKRSFVAGGPLAAILRWQPACRTFTANAKPKII